MCYSYLKTKQLRYWFVVLVGNLSERMIMQSNKTLQQSEGYLNTYDGVFSRE